MAGMAFRVPQSGVRGLETVRNAYSLNLHAGEEPKVDISDHEWSNASNTGYRFS
jgi:hypothetical protein